MHQQYPQKEVCYMKWDWDSLYCFLKVDAFTLLNSNQRDETRVSQPWSKAAPYTISELCLPDTDPGKINDSFTFTKSVCEIRWPVLWTIPRSWKHIMLWILQLELSEDVVTWFALKISKMWQLLRISWFKASNKVMLSCGIMGCAPGPVSMTTRMHPTRLCLESRNPSHMSHIQNS